MNIGISRGAMMGGPGIADGMPFAFGSIWLAAFVGLVLLAIIVVAVIVWVITQKPAGTSVSGPATPAPPASGDSARAIARDRLARGEIEPEQYTAIMNALNGSATTPALDG